MLLLPPLLVLVLVLVLVLLVLLLLISFDCAGAYRRRLPLVRRRARRGDLAAAVATHN